MFAFYKCDHAPILFLRSYHDDTENCPQWENNSVYNDDIERVAISNRLSHKIYGVTLATGCSLTYTNQLKSNFVVSDCFG